MRANVDTTATAFALVSGRLPSAVAIYRLSGPRAFAYAESLTGKPLPRDRGMRTTALPGIDPRALVLTFVGPNSFTGEDVIELQIHGALAIARRLESALLELGARPAIRGEFTYRALLNGRTRPEDIDEVGDLFLAKHPFELDRIYARRTGALEADLASLRARLVEAQAIFDTAVDFSEEYSAVVQQATLPIQAATRECSALTQRYKSFKQGVSVPRLVLAGAPNAGKSSLFNALLNRERTIVDATPGTTRDVIEEEIWIEGAPWRLVDTAGLRESADRIESRGIEFGRDFIDSASFVLWVVDSSRGIEGEIPLGTTPHAIFWNKTDLAPAPEGALQGSVRDGESIAALWAFLRQALPKLTSTDPRPLPSASQASRLEAVEQRLRRMEGLVVESAPPEILGEENRASLRLLEDLLGEVSADDVLDRLFRDFCIGK